MLKSRPRRPRVTTRQSRRKIRRTRSAVRSKNIERAVSSGNPETSAALSLLNASAVRERAHRMLAIGLDGKLPNFRVDLDHMDGAIDLVLETTRKAYPSFDVPFHSRWRHFVTNGDNRWAAIADQTKWPDRATRARAEFALA